VLQFLMVVIVAVGCSEDDGLRDYKNDPPTVWITGGPPEGEISSYKIDFSWGGSDPDGEIAYYEYCITDNEDAFDPADTTGADKWTRTGETSDTFVFSADQLVDSLANDQVEEFRRSHTFFVRAVDDDGATSPVPAYRSFTSMTLSPEVYVLIPRKNALTPAEMPPVCTYRWEADDYVDDRQSRQDPEYVSWILEPLSAHSDGWRETVDWIRSLPVDDPRWGDWVPYPGTDDAGKSWTTPTMELGYYVFAIRAKDEAGAITPVFDEEKNVRRVYVSRRTTGPILTVHNRFVGSVRTYVCNTPLTIIDLPAGIPLEFSWCAEALYYGGMVAGYRYGWDVADLNDPTQWEIDFTPFPPHGEGEPACAQTAQPRQFHYGTHVFTIEVVDNHGMCSRAEVKINSVLFTMENDLLLVDDYAESDWSGWENPQDLGVEPNDAEHDEFWIQALADVYGFNPDQDIVEVDGRAGSAVPLTKLAQYKSIIWSSKGHRTQKNNLPTWSLFSWRRAGTSYTAASTRCRCLSTTCTLRSPCATR
jgi:hypothetical protein